MMMLIHTNKSPLKIKWIVIDKEWDKSSYSLAEVTIKIQWDSNSLKAFHNKIIIWWHLINFQVKEKTSSDKWMKIEHHSKL